MPKRRFDKLDPEVRARILQAAALEFGTHGFADASLNRIVEQAGISKGSMYYYFEDKEDLFGMVLQSLEDLSAEIVKRPLEQLTAETYWPSVATAFRAWLQIAVANPWVHGFLQMFSEMLRNPPTEGPLVAWHAKMTQQRLEFIRKGQELGVVRTDLPLDFLSEYMNGLQLVHGRYFMKRFPEMSPEEQQRMAEIMIDVSRRVLVPAPPGATTPTTPSSTGSAKRKSTQKK